MGPQAHNASADAVVIARAVEEPEAFAELFERHFSLVYRFLMLRVGEQAACDLAAETFTIAFRRRADYDVRRSDARPWLLGIATKLALEQRRLERRRHDMLLRLAHERPESQDDLSPWPAAGPQREILRETLEELPGDERDLLLLYGCVGLSYAEIADALSLPLGTVRSRIHRLRHKLRGRLNMPAQEVRP